MGEEDEGEKAVSGGNNGVRGAGLLGRGMLLW